ncbi:MULTISPECIES: hypothetical protein [Kitasatospora]|uniref:Uncharacterized protein n=1 Tax=Kitasatospora setae (strain ATCC 33774 / DSM 43861 / JCM 3304 / KCC A-0304 / NBRC 14216 / KM-6054) TaxID=452652 RepID=E4NAG8_KITSK|nr:MULTISPECIES: hypothetical protein [Kitasatospora]BAJ28199.1 hypothetical protein KSE_23820 [Kitasatospora setae KM-6054]
MTDRRRQALRLPLAGVAILIMNKGGHILMCDDARNAFLTGHEGQLSILWEPVPRGATAERTALDLLAGTWADSRLFDLTLLGKAESLPSGISKLTVYACQADRWSAPFPGMRRQAWLPPTISLAAFAPIAASAIQVLVEKATRGETAALPSWATAGFTRDNPDRERTRRLERQVELLRRAQRTIPPREAEPADLVPEEYVGSSRPDPEVTATAARALRYDPRPQRGLSDAMATIERREETLIAQMHATAEADEQAELLHQRPTPEEERQHRLRQLLRHGTNV